MGDGREYFWLSERIMNDYRLTEQQRQEVQAEAVYLAFTVPYDLSFTLMRWAVIRAIRMHCVTNPRYPLLPIHLIEETTWSVPPSEVKESNLRRLDNFRNTKSLSEISA